MIISYHVCRICAGEWRGKDQCAGYAGYQYGGGAHQGEFPLVFDYLISGQCDMELARCLGLILSLHMLLQVNLCFCKEKSVSVFFS